MYIYLLFKLFKNVVTFILCVGGHIHKEISYIKYTVKTIEVGAGFNHII